MNYIEVKGLRKSFSSKNTIVKAVDNVSFNVKKGEIFGLLGPNGAGKTTTIDILAGLTEKDSGTIKILNKDPEKDWEYVKNNMNTTTAYYPLSDVLTVYQNLKVYAKLYGVKKIDEKINRLLDQFELKRLINRRVHVLSSGERTRVALCKGLINDPKVLLLDECTVGLDPDIAEKTRTLIKDYNKETRCSILFTSHYMFEAEELCKRIAFMDNGRIYKIGTSAKLKEMIKQQTVEIATINHNRELIKLLKQKGINIHAPDNTTVVFDVESRVQVFKLMSRIFEKGIKLKELHIKQPTLDDIFIKIARK